MASPTQPGHRGLPTLCPAGVTKPVVKADFDDGWRRHRPSIAMPSSTRAISSAIAAMPFVTAAPPLTARRLPVQHSSR